MDPWWRLPFPKYHRYSLFSFFTGNPLFPYPLHPPTFPFLTFTCRTSPIEGYCLFPCLIRDLSFKYEMTFPLNPPNKPAPPFFSIRKQFSPSQPLNHSLPQLPSDLLIQTLWSCRSLLKRIFSNITTPPSPSPLRAIPSFHYHLFVLEPSAIKTTFFSYK